MKIAKGTTGLVFLVIFVLGGTVFAGAPVAISPENGIEEAGREIEKQGSTVTPLALEGTSNTLFGTGAGAVLGDDDDRATFIGYQAGFKTNDGANDNTFVGYQSGYANTTGSANTFLGSNAGITNSTGTANTFLGQLAGGSNTTASNNTFVGTYAGTSNTTGLNNTFLGMFAGSLNTTGESNTSLGMEAGYGNTIGDYNTFLGRGAGFSNNEGESNTFMGALAGSNNTTGSSNVFLGYRAGHNNSTGSSNVFLGHRAGESETGSNRLYIDNTNTSTPLIYGQFDNHRLTVNGNLQVIGPDNGVVRLSNVTTNNTTKGARMVLNHYSNAALPLYLFGAASTATDNFVAFGGGNPIGNAATQIDLFTAANTTTPTGTARITVKSNGFVGIGTQFPAAPLQMAGGAYTNGAGWFNASSREYKANIRDLRAEDAMEALKGLNPVTFSYKASPGENHTGFIAEEVPDLVATKDRKGLSPMDIVAVLTKALKEQQKVAQELKAENEILKTNISSLSQRLLILEGKVIAGK